MPRPSRRRPTSISTAVRRHVLLTLLAGPLATAMAACAENEHAANGTCSACAIGLINTAGDDPSTTTACQPCTPATPGSCVTGCAENYYQSAGADSTSIVCTACSNGGTLAAAAVQSGTTACNCSPGLSGAGCASGTAHTALTWTSGGPVTGQSRMQGQPVSSGYRFSLGVTTSLPAEQTITITASANLFVADGVGIDAGCTATLDGTAVTEVDFQGMTTPVGNGNTLLLYARHNPLPAGALLVDCTAPAAFAALPTAGVVTFGVVSDADVAALSGQTGFEVVAPCGENTRVVGGVCTPCAIGQIKAAGDDPSLTDTGCSQCDPDTPGSCATGCATNYFQSAGSPGSDSVVCTPCAAGSSLPAAAVAPAPTACQAQACPVNQRVLSHACVPCPAGQVRAAGDLTTGADTFCADCPDGAAPGTCASGCPAGRYQSTGTNATAIVCSRCAEGTTHAAAPVQNTPKTESEACTTCDVDHRVLNGQCTACPEGYTRAAGDIFASSGDTACSICSVGFHVFNGACTRCPAGETRAAGDTVGAGNVNTTCTPIVCGANEHVTDGKSCQTCGESSLTMRLALCVKSRSHGGAHVSHPTTRLCLSPLFPLSLFFFHSGGKNPKRRGLGNERDDSLRRMSNGIARGPVQNWVPGKLVPKPRLNRVGCRLPNMPRRLHECGGNDPRHSAIGAEHCVRAHDLRGKPTRAWTRVCRMQRRGSNSSGRRRRRWCRHAVSAAAAASSSSPELLGQRPHHLRFSVRWKRM